MCKNEVCGYSSSVEHLPSHVKPWAPPAAWQVKEKIKSSLKHYLYIKSEIVQMSVNREMAKLCYHIIEYFMSS